MIQKQTGSIRSMPPDLDAESSSGLVAIAHAKHPIPSRTRPLSAAAPMVLRLKAWESRSPPSLMSFQRISIAMARRTRRAEQHPPAGTAKRVRASSDIRLSLVPSQRARSHVAPACGTPGSGRDWPCNSLGRGFQDDPASGGTLDPSLCRNVATFFIDMAFRVLWHSHQSDARNPGSPGAGRFRRDGVAISFEQWGGSRPKSEGRKLDCQEWDGFRWNFVSPTKEALMQHALRWTRLQPFVQDA